MPRLSLSTPVMTPVYRATLALFLMMLLGLLLFGLMMFEVLDGSTLYYFAIVPMGVVWSLRMQSDWAMGIAIILGVYALCIALVELAFSRRGKIAWRSLAFLIVYLAAMPLMDRFYGHLV